MSGYVLPGPDDIVARTETGYVAVLRPNGTWTYSADQSSMRPAAQVEGFRGIPWGSERTSILATESQPPVDESADSLVFDVQMLDLSYVAVHGLNDGRLVRGSLIQTSRHSSDNHFLGDYDSIVQLLTRKYGAPQESNIYWIDDLYKDEPDSWGFAVAAGHHSRFTRWVLPDTEIIAGLHGDNHEISVIAEFQWRSAQASIQAARISRDLEQI